MRRVISRPVSVTSVVCKVVESIIRDELIKVTEANGIFSDEQDWEVIPDEST